MALLGRPGPRQSDTFAVASGDTTGDVFSAIFGPPKRRFEFDPRHNLAQELFSKTELFEGKNFYAGTFFRGMLFESHNPFVLRRLLPPRRRDDINFVYQYYDFPRIPAIATASQAPAHKVTALRKSSTATMERYSLAVEDTAEAQRTVEGQMILAGKILSMAMGFIEMMEINGFRAMLEQPTYYKKYWLEAQLHSFDFDDKVAIETWQFAAIQKHPNGFASLFNGVAQDMAQTSDYVVNYVIIPEGTRGLISAMPELQNYSIRGEGNQQFADLMADAPDLQNGYPKSKFEWVVARGVEFDGADIYYDPLSRDLVIGSHYRIDFFGKKCIPATWCTDNMTIAIHSMDGDDDHMVRITVQDALANCERFDDSFDRNLRSLHDDLAARATEYANEANLPIDGRPDMFLYGLTGEDGAITYNKVQIWAQMEEYALPYEAVKTTRDSIAHFLSKRVGQLGIDAIEAGLKAIDEMWNAPIGPNDIEYMQYASFAPLNDGDTLGDGSVGGGPLVPRIPTAPAFIPDAAGPEREAALGAARLSALYQNYVPRGFGTVPGLIAIADDAGAGGAEYGYLNQSIVQRAVAFKDAFEKIFDANEEIFTEKHIMLDEAYVPNAYAAGGVSEAAQRYRRLVTFGSNLFDGNKLPLLQAGAVATNEVLAPPFDTISAVLQEGASGPLRSAFSTTAALNAFKQQFANSAFGRTYQAQVTAAAVAPARRRGGARAVNVTTTAADDEDEEPIAPTTGIPANTDPLTRFQIAEVQPRMNAARDAAEADAPGTGDEAANAVAAAIYGNLIRNIRTSQAPTRISRQLIDSWGGQAQEYLNRQSTIATRTATDMYLTRLSAPIDRVLASGSAQIAVASPINNARALDVNSTAALAAARKTARDNIDALTTFAQAHTQRRGYRGTDETDGGNGDDDEDDTRNAPLFTTARGPNTAAAGVFYDTIVDDGQGRLVKNTNAINRYTRAGKISNWLLRLSEQMTLLAPVNGRVLQNMADNDVPLPCSFLLEQPFVGATTKAIIFAALSNIDPLGETAFQDPDTHFSRDANRKTFYIHTSVWTASLISDTRRYTVVPDAINSSINYGANARPIKMAEFDAADVLKMDAKSAGMFYFMEPARALIGKMNSVPRKHDIRGVYNPTIYKYRNEGSSATLSENHLSHPSALYYNIGFGLQDLQVLMPMEKLIFSNIEGYTNSITLQGLQQLFLGPDCESPSCIIKPSDHRGEAAYPGAGRLWRNGSIAEVFIRDYYRNSYYAE